MCALNVERSYEIEWVSDRSSEAAPAAGDGEGFCEELQAGDRIGVWARAQFLGWQNHILEVGQEVVLEID
jgi:hypothetical protein